MSDLRDAVAEGFGACYGRSPDGIWSAPGRVNLIGEHTDYNDGFALPFAIDRRTVLALALRDDGRMRVGTSLSPDVVELDRGRLAQAEGWSAYPLGVAWALGQASVVGEAAADLAAVPGFDVYLDSEVPLGAGLSSSAAIECAMAVALNDVWRLGLDRRALVKAGQAAENTVVGAPTGFMDQTASLFGARDQAVLLDCRSFQIDQVALGFAEAGLTVLVIDTGVDHAHATGGYAARRRSCEAAAAALGVPSLREVGVADLDRARTVLDDETFRRTRHVVTENQRVLDTVRLLREAGPSAIGELLDDSHRSMRDDFEISVPELDLAVETAQSAGALGARMTGGGFGGAAIALVPHELLSLVQVAVDGAFAEHGYAQPESFVVDPSHGACRDR